MTVKIPIQIFTLLNPPDYTNLQYYLPNSHPVRTSTELGTQTQSNEIPTQTSNDLTNQTDGNDTAPNAWSEVAVEVKSNDVIQEPSNAPVT